MNESVYPGIDESLIRRRRELAAETRKAFSAFSRQVFAAGALPAKIKQLIAVAVAHVTQCPYCIESHTPLAVKAGASDKELQRMEADLHQHIRLENNILFPRAIALEVR